MSHSENQSDDDSRLMETDIRPPGDLNRYGEMSCGEEEDNQPIGVTSEVRVPTKAERCTEMARGPVKKIYSSIHDEPHNIYISHLTPRTFTEWSKQAWREFETFIEAANAERRNLGLDPYVIRDVTAYMHKDIQMHIREYLISINHPVKYTWHNDMEWEDLRKVLNMAFTATRKIHQDRQ